MQNKAVSCNLLDACEVKNSLGEDPCILRSLKSYLICDAFNNIIHTVHSFIFARS